MREYSLSPRETMLPAILDEFRRVRDVLIALNHPFWLEERVTEGHHCPALERILRECGGDRHGCEPSACINLTNAASFAEFVSEIHGGCSSILFMPHYREPMAQRIFETSRDILRTYPEYPARERWTDRIFDRGEEGVARTVAQVWQHGEPGWLNGAAAAIQFLGGTRFRPALRLLLSERGELHPLTASPSLSCYTPGDSRLCDFDDARVYSLYLFYFGARRRSLPTMTTAVPRCCPPESESRPWRRRARISRR